MPFKGGSARKTVILAGRDAKINHTHGEGDNETTGGNWPGGDNAGFWFDYDWGRWRHAGNERERALDVYHPD